MAGAAGSANYDLVIWSIFKPIQMEDLCINRAEVWPSCSLSATRFFFSVVDAVFVFLRLFFPFEIMSIYIYIYMHAHFYASEKMSVRRLRMTGGRLQ